MEGTHVELLDNCRGKGRLGLRKLSIGVLDTIDWEKNSLGIIRCILTGTVSQETYNCDEKSETEISSLESDISKVNTENIATDASFGDCQSKLDISTWCIGSGAQ